MSLINILIVEDDDAQVATWKRQITRANALNADVDLSADYVATQSGAIRSIELKKYDAAVVDIRLQSEDGVNDATSGGNQVRDKLLESEIVLVAHVTGEPNEVSYENDKYAELVRVFTKGEFVDDGGSVHDEIIAWVMSKIDILKTMKSVKSEITAKMADLFYSSIWPRWDSWSAPSEQEMEFKALCISRHMSSHLYSEFLNIGEGKVHPEEWYFQPPSKTRFHTGDIAYFEDIYYVLVTPRCDLERIEPTDTLQLARLDIADDWESDLNELSEKVAAQSEKYDAAEQQEQKDSCQKKINNLHSAFRKKYYGHRDNSPKYHFLPEINDGNVSHGPFYVDFSVIRSVIFESEEADTLRGCKIASISSEFVPALVQRLGSYISRIGSPDYSHTHL